MSNQELITHFQCPHCFSEFDCSTEEVKCPRCGHTATCNDLPQFLRRYEVIAEDYLTETTKLCIIKVEKGDGGFFYVLRSETKEMELSQSGCWFRATAANLFIDRITEDPLLYSSLIEFAHKHGLPTNCALEPSDRACPRCGSTRLQKSGILQTRHGDVQRYTCKHCEYRFSQGLNKPQLGGPVPSMRVLTEGSKNLTTETRTEEAQREATATHPTEPTIAKGKAIEFTWWMKKEGYAENTITRRAKLLLILAKRGADILDPESVKVTISKQEPWNLKTKELAVEAYSCFLKMVGGKWNPPIYKAANRLPFIPTEQEIDSLIAGSNRRTSTFLQLLKETGMRSGEAWMLKWTDIDFENKLVKVTPEKGSEPRALPMRNKLIAMLNNLPKTQPEVFKGSLIHFGRSFRAQRKAIAHKLQNDRILKITFHTLRHWKATMEYARTKDILHVMKILGHRSIQNTLLYTQLVNFESDNFHSATAKTVEEAQKLVEAGFEHVCDFDNVKLFRKRK